LVGRIRGRGADVSGELIVTSVAVLAPRLVPLLVEFMGEHPEIRVRYLTDQRLFKLEYGEAHVAIRAGKKPDQPDNIVQPLAKEPIALYATQAYRDQNGPLVDGEWEAHRFVATDDVNSRAPFYRWMHETIPADRIVYRASQDRTAFDGVYAGAGIGFLFVHEAQNNPDLVQMLPPRDGWSSHLWLVTHVDLHRTAKVQTMVQFLKAQIKDWTHD
jgi:DNA-binding transcriptional LysR family regulator